MSLYFFFQKMCLLKFERLLFYPTLLIFGVLFSSQAQIHLPFHYFSQQLN